MQPITLDDYGKVAEPGAVKFSPDGKKIAFFQDGTLCVLAAEPGSEPVKLTKAGTGYNSTRPQWSADGKNIYLSFYSDEENTWQIWTASADNTGLPDRKTRTSAEAASIFISPDEQLWLFGSSEQPVVWPAGKPPSDKAVVIDAMVLKQDGKGFVASDANDNVYAWEIEDRVPHQLTDATGHDSEAAWSPDGNNVAFIREDLSRPEYRSTLCTTPMTKAGPRRPKVLASSAAERRTPRWSPDGQQIAYLWRDAKFGPYAVTQLAVVSPNGGPEKIITKKLGRTVTDFQYSLDGKFIYFVYDNKGGQHFARIRLSNKRIEKLITGEHCVTSFDLNKDGHVVLTLKGMNDASDIYLLNDELPDKLTRLTNFNQNFFESRKLGSKEQLFYELDDGVKVQSLITKPADFNPKKKYPTILRIHGGPVQQATFGYDFFSQYLAANGYVVVEPNPPGSTGRGQSFISKARKDWGFKTNPDILGAIDQVIALGYADPDNLAVIGYSYGGYMTNCLITLVPDKFKVAVSGAGHSLIAANYGHDIYLKWYNWGLGFPWNPKNRKNYENLSPLYHADKVKTPTMFLCGAQDWNVPLLNSELFYQALKVMGVPTRLVVYPKAAHVAHWYAGDVDNGKDYYARVANWLGEFIET